MSDTGDENGESLLGAVEQLDVDWMALEEALNGDGGGSVELDVQCAVAGSGGLDNSVAIWFEEAGGRWTKVACCSQ